MEIDVNGKRLSLVRGDITGEAVDAIVNAANSRLAGGGGVDGAIHRRGGPAIMEECGKMTGGCPTGSAVITGGGRLKARHVIHTVGPVYRDGSSGEEALLKSAYGRSLALAEENGLKTVSFPSISTGAYGYPIEDAAGAALLTVIEFLKEKNGVEAVRFVLFSDRDLEVYTKVLKSIAG